MPSLTFSPDRWQARPIRLSTNVTIHALRQAASRSLRLARREGQEVYTLAAGREWMIEPAGRRRWAGGTITLEAA